MKRKKRQRRQRKNEQLDNQLLNKTWGINNNNNGKHVHDDWRWPTLDFISHSIIVLLTRLITSIHLNVNPKTMHAHLACLKIFL